MKTLKTYWWLLALRGLFGILVGILAIAWPGITLEVFIIFLAAYLLVEGALTVLSGLVSMSKGLHWVLLLVEGAAALFAGWVVIATPGIAVFTLTLFIQILAIWLMIGGALRIALALKVRAKIKNEFFMMLSGILSLVVGLWIFVQPGIGIMTLIWLFGFSAIFTGIFFIAFSMLLKESKV